MKSNQKRGKTSKDRKIGHLDEQTLSYYRRVSEMLKQDFSDAEERALFLDNVFKQLSLEALKVSQNQTGSGIVEELIRYASGAQLASIMRPFAVDWETACCDRFASYVTQTMVLQCSQFLASPSNATSDTEEKTANSIKQLFNSLFEFICSSLAFHMQHAYASHIVRVFFEVLTGKPISDSVVRSRLSRYQKQASSQAKAVIALKVPPAVYFEKLHELCKQIVELKKLEDHVQHSLANPVLQAMLLSLKSLEAEKSAALIKKFTKNAKLFDSSISSGIPDIIFSEIGSHLVEQYLGVISERRFDRIYRKFFCGHLVEMACHPLGNFVLQKFISLTHTSEQFQQVHDELIDSFEQILALNHTGVILRLAEVCVKHSTRQKKFLKALQKSFHCYKPVERQLKLVPLLASLSTFEVFYKLRDDSTQADSTEAVPEVTESSESIVKGFNLQGSLLAQSLVQFGNPHPVVDSLLTLSKPELCSVCCDASGSRVIEALVSSGTVGEASRAKLFDSLKGLYFTLACDKWGSRTFDALWNSASVDQRVQIVSELTERANALRANKFGSFIHERCALRTFMSRRDEWRQLQSGQTKKRKMLKAVIEEQNGDQKTVSPAKRKRSD